MEWQQIVGFHELVKHGSFTQAAHASFRTQSALSQQIKKLEDEFQCQLINRISKKKFTLTPAGERLYRFASSILKESENLQNDISAIKGLPCGKLRIAAPFTTLYHLFPERFKDYLRSYPHIELTILDRPQSQAMELLKNGDIDMAVALQSLVPKGFDVRKWKEVESVLIVPERHPLLRIKQLQLSDIAEYPLIMPPQSVDSRSRNLIVEQFEREGIEYRIVMESSNVELSARYVEAGIGISFATVAKGLTPTRAKKISTIPMTKYLKPDYISLVCRKQKLQPIYIESFILNILKS